MAIPYSVSAYTREVLCKALVAYSHEQNPDVAQKPQVRFLDQHLTALRCATMIVEPTYTDRDFLEDYAAYYVRCFEPYRRVCTRLHFFAEALDDKIVRKAIVEDDAAILGDYLGFIVVKPLPTTVIGRTCLKPFTAEGRRFPPVKRQSVDLYGLELSVETLPFQEQDREVAACASSALWTMLHSTASLFHHPKPSPVEITKAATTYARVNGRTFPNGDGLNTLQIADAVRAVGLEPFLLPVSSMPRMGIPYEEFAVAPEAALATSSDPALAARMRLILKIAVLAYLRSGIACVLLSRTSDEVDVLAGEMITPFESSDAHDGRASESERQNAGTSTAETVVLRGNHAVAITGYELVNAILDEVYPDSGTLFAAARVKKLFVHDDQTGPFTSFTFEEGNRLVAEDFAQPSVSRRFAEPINFVVPLYHKIRIPLRQVIDLTIALDEAIVALPIATRERLEWDVELVSLEALRNDFASSSINASNKLDLLTLALPRFTWRIRALHTGKPAFDLLLDATDLLQGKLVRKVVPYNLPLSREISAVFSLSAHLLDPLLQPTIDAFAEITKLA